MYRFEDLAVDQSTIHRNGTVPVENSLEATDSHVAGEFQGQVLGDGDTITDQLVDQSIALEGWLKKIFPNVHPGLGIASTQAVLEMDCLYLPMVKDIEVTDQPDCFGHGLVGEEIFPGQSASALTNSLDAIIGQTQHFGVVDGLVVMVNPDELTDLAQALHVLETTVVVLAGEQQIDHKDRSADGYSLPGYGVSIIPGDQSDTSRQLGDGRTASAVIVRTVIDADRVPRVIHGKSSSSEK